MKRLLVLGLLLVAVGCSSGGSGMMKCNTGFALPAGFPQTTDGFYGLSFSDCQYTQAEMDTLRADMKRASVEIMACLDAVYDYDFRANSKDNIGFPYASVVKIVPEKFEGRDGKMRHIQYLSAGYFVKYHPTKSVGGQWNLQWWAGELHTMYRVEMLGSWDHGVVYDKNLPFENAANIANKVCIRQWKP